MGSVESLALFSTQRKKEVKKGGPHPHEPRTEDGPESLWL